MEISGVCVMLACIITVITVDGQVEGSFGRPMIPVVVCSGRRRGSSPPRMCDPGWAV